MEIVIQLLINLVLCLIGMIGYGLWSTRNHMHDFNWSIFIGHNKVFWIWSGIAQFLYATLMAFYPMLEVWISAKLIKVWLGYFLDGRGLPKFPYTYFKAGLYTDNTPTTKGSVDYDDIVIKRGGNLQYSDLESPKVIEVKAKYEQGLKSFMMGF